MITKHLLAQFHLVSQKLSFFKPWRCHVEVHGKTFSYVAGVIARAHITSWVIILHLRGTVSALQM